MQIKIASVDSVILYFSDEISKEISLIVKNAYGVLKQANNKALSEIIPSYNSILVTYDIFSFDFESISNYLTELLKEMNIKEGESQNIINIDVYYGLDVGLDLKRLSKITNLSIEDIIILHSSKVYDVCAIGFLPGFAFMASVDDAIAVSRLQTPRKKIPKGSVAIANNQTAVYPSESPGGWNIIGKTTYEFFDKKLETLSPLSVESKIQFNPISKEEFLSQGGII